MKIKVAKGHVFVISNEVEGWVCEYASVVFRSFSLQILGSIFSASLSEATLEFGFPVDYNLVFVILSITMLVCVLMVACLPVSINHQKIIEDV